MPCLHIGCRILRTSTVFAALLAAFPPRVAEPAAIVHYAPAENLEHIDAVLIDQARHEIDMAAYVLTDWPVIQALTRVAKRGVNVRIYLDGEQLSEREPAGVLQDLAETPGVEIRIKRDKGAPMHLKSYQIDRRMLRTGAANFSASGLKHQDNDLVVIESAHAAAAFKRKFDTQFAAGKMLALGSVAGLMTVAQAESIAPRDAPSHVGQTATVCGDVSSAHYAAQSKGHPTFLDRMAHILTKRLSPSFGETIGRNSGRLSKGWLGSGSA
jgi:phosphatidylserine/phosphatidylglycerophosphate/cardiolipin synthase-like enzyme